MTELHTLKQKELEQLHSLVPRNESLGGRSESTNAIIHDFRDKVNPNNHLILGCPHATNKLPEGFHWSENDKKNFSEKHWAIDIGALDMALDLAKELKCILLQAKYSRLVVDANRDVNDDDIILKEGDGNKVEMNQNLTKDQYADRVNKYHKSYYDAMDELSKKLKPQYAFSIHSFSPEKEGQSRPTEVDVMSIKSKELAERVCQEFKSKGWKAVVNEPYEGREGNSLPTMIDADPHNHREGVGFEIRNDLLQNTETRERLRKDILDIIRNVCEVKHQSCE